MRQHQTALVTGSARRLGRHIAAWLVGRGWRVVVHATAQDAAGAAARELGAVGGIGADLRDLGECRRLVDEALALAGGDGLDLLVNNAGTFVRRDVRDTTLDDWTEAMQVNARAPFFIAQRAAPALALVGGLVVNISDRAAHEHWVTHPVHSASKAALESLTLSMAKAWRDEGIRVCGIAPGTVLPPDDASPQMLERLARRSGLGTPEHVTDALGDLLASPYRTGEIVVL